MIWYSVYFGGIFIYITLVEERAQRIASRLADFNLEHRTDYKIEIKVEEEGDG